MKSLLLSTRLNVQPIHAFLGRNFSLLRRYCAWEATWLVYSSAIVMSIGFLAVGSKDSDRFHPGMSIDFLTRLGDLIAGSLKRF